jgi:hypothetical protein
VRLAWVDNEYYWQTLKGDPIMKKVLLLIVIFLAGLIAGLLLPAEWRAKLFQPLAARIGPCLEHMPDG